MEGAGSRMSRASSRYGPTATVFNGPVRKWKKRWVHVSPSSAAPTNHHKPHFQPNNPSSTLFLCRWTPVSSGAPAASGGDDGSGSAQEAPRRKYRYTPIAALDDHTKTTAKKADEGKISKKFLSTDGPVIENDDIYGKIDHTEDEEKEIQNSSKGGLDLGLSPDKPENGHDEIEDQSSSMVKTTTSGFWSME